MEDVRHKVSGGNSGALLKDELRLQPRTELQKILQELKLDQVVIPNGSMLAAKVGMGMNWSQCRKLRRWLKQYGVTMESERTSRKIAAELLSGIQVTAEKLPFSAKGDGTHGTVQLQPCAYVSSLKDAIFDHLQRCKAANSLTWHNNTIPEREVWIKVGGDHGGGSFKMTFQVLNKDRPNSRSNTNVFCVFNAKDTRENLHLATSRYAAELKTLQESKWTCDDGEFKVRIFAAGDYAYLCLWYGLSGACGHSPCLWCYITQAEIADWEERRIHVPPRTLDNLAADHQRFMQEGKGNIKKAKLYSNVIAPVMFNVPVDQVVIPGLHISLGLYVKLFKLLEAELQDVDLKLQAHLMTEENKAAIASDEDLRGFQSSVDTVDQARVLEDQADAVEEEQEELESQLAWLAYSDGVEDEMAEAVFNEACAMVKELYEEKESLRRKADVLRKAASLKVGEGPLTRQLDPVLQRFNVKRQAYHSQSFIGNHVNRMLQNDAIQELTSIVKTTVDSMMEKYDDLPLSLVPLATSTAWKFEQLFTRFSRCHAGYSHSEPMDERAIADLRSAISSFMEFYREQVPQGTVPVKMHLLEDHVVPFIQQWGFGLGFMGEQGIEQVHALFNSLSRTTCGIADPVARIRATLTNHLIGVSPDQAGGIPEPVPRKSNK
ncbi:uncharacterized protein LOC144926373 [Branchiostoma floridae x Branchiostoma belcheri]